jgi:hypothetical protein
MFHGERDVVIETACRISALSFSTALILSYGGSVGLPGE